MSIVDNNVLSALAKIERLDLLPAVFDSVGTPTAVVDELDRAEAAGYDFVSRIDSVKAYNGGWLEVIPPRQSELGIATDVRDHALSTTDARCLAISLIAIVVVSYRRSFAPLSRSPVNSYNNHYES